MIMIFSHMVPFLLVMIVEKYVVTHTIVHVGVEFRGNQEIVAVIYIG